MKTSNFSKGQFLVVPNKSIVLKLRGASVNIYLAIIDHSDNEGKCFPSYKRLSEETGYKKRQCIDAIANLVKVGLLKKTGRARGDGSQTSNMYSVQLIHIPSVPQRTPPSAPQDTPPGAPERTPELYPGNSIHLNSENVYKNIKTSEASIAQEAPGLGDGYAKAKAMRKQLASKLAV